MKKYFLIFALGLFSFLPFTTVSALDLGTQYTKNAAKEAGFDERTDATSVSQTIGMVIKVALSLVGTIFLALTVYAGFLWMTASGDESKIEKAQNIIRSAIIGLIIALSAYGITDFVVGRVVEKTTSSQGAGAP